MVFDVIGTSRGVLHGQPRATIAIVAVSLLLSVWLWVQRHYETAEAHKVADEIVDMWREASYVTMPQAVLDRLDPVTENRYADAQAVMQKYRADPGSFKGRLDPERADAAVDRARWKEGPNVPVGVSVDSLIQDKLTIAALAHSTGGRRRLMQERIDELGDELERTETASLVRVGFTPATPGVPALFTYSLFNPYMLHGLALLMFLFVAGGSLEEVWGWRRIVELFLLCSVVPALGHTLLYPGSPVPLIGASAAVAGITMAFAVRLPDRQVELTSIIPFFRGHSDTRSFHVSAWLLVPMFYGVDIAATLVLDGAELQQWHLIGGMVTGAISAVALKAVERRGGGLVPQRAPVEFADVGLAEEAPTVVAPPLLGSQLKLRDALSRKDMVAALELYRKLQRSNFVPELLPLFEHRLARALEDEGDFAEAARADYRAFAADSGPPNGPRALFNYGRLLTAHLGNVEAGIQVLEQVLEHYPTSEFAGPAGALAQTYSAAR